MITVTMNETKAKANIKKLEFPDTCEKIFTT